MLRQVETPAYLFNPATVVATYSALKAALGTQLMVSLKANPNIDLFVRCAHAYTDGIELASQGELNLLAGRTRAPKFVNAPSLDEALLKAAVLARAQVVLDNLEQVEMAVAAVKTGLPLTAVILRVNAASILGNCGNRVQADHFGMDVEALLIAIQSLTAAGVSVRGLHIFAGSYSFDLCGVLLCENTINLLGALAEKLPKPIEFLNLGGGFADDWSADHPGFAEYRRALAKIPAHVTVAHEAGRAIFSRGGIFAAKVLAVKLLNKRRIVICDGGLAHCFMLAQTEKMFKRLRRPRIVPIGDGLRAAIDGPVQFVGNSCNRSDVIGELTEGILPRPGDLVAFDGCGAYHTYTPKNFLELKPPKHYIVS